jgi:hypothetical protein
MHGVSESESTLLKLFFPQLFGEAFQKNGVPTLAGIPFIETLKGGIPFVEMPCIFSIFS